MAFGYLTIDGEYENLIVIERSKFICYIKGVENEEEAKEYVAKIKKQHSLATHNCYAYIADEKGLIQKFSDDGEPQGTAGVPMLEALKGKKIFKVVAVVTRYFGGVKLGTGGLARAYSGSVTACLDKCKKVKKELVKYFLVHSDYDGYSKLLKCVNDGVIITNIDFSLGVNINFAVKEEFVDAFIVKLKDIFKGREELEQLGEGFYPFKSE